MAAGGAAWGAALGALAVAAAAYKARALTADGALAAALVGFVVVLWGGVGAAFVLLLFFVSASAWTRMGAGRRRGRGPGRSVAEDRGDAGGRRAAQVAANGAVPALAVAAAYWWPAPWWPAAFAGALAAVTADTWATEIGAFSRRPPVLITTGRRAAPGRSGAVSLLGTAGGAAGAFALAAGAAAAFARWPFAGVGGGTGPGLWVYVAAGGAGGMILDSILGATAQARFRCGKCGGEEEAPFRCCGAPATLDGGWRPLTNDGVNFVASLAGAFIAGLLAAMGR